MHLQISRTFKEVAGASIGWAVVMIVLGLLAVILPVATGIAVSVIVAWVVALSGLAYVVSAVADRNAGAFIWRLLIGLIYIGGGGYLLFHPQIALEALTWSSGRSLPWRAFWNLSPSSSSILMRVPYGRSLTASSHC